MRIARVRAGDGARLVAIDGDEAIDLSALGVGDDVVAAAMVDVARRDEVAAVGARTSLADLELLTPVPDPPNFLAIGLNYRDHIEEGGRPVPEFPVFFNKQRTCVVGPGEPIHIPTVAPDKVDYEGELAMVIGHRCRHVPRDRAQEVIAGYFVCNDVSVRDWQRRSPTMTLGKSWDTHGPIGPWLVTSDEVPDPHVLDMRTYVNDELRQDSNTRHMVFDCYDQIETLSTVCTLEVGDIIATGTSSGVGLYYDPPKMLKAGDTVRIEIDGVGVLENPVIAEPADTALLPPG